MQDYSKDSIPAGTIVITRNGWEDKLYNISDLVYMKELTVGQLFNAVARYYNKNKSSYKNVWPVFKAPNGDVSKAFMILQRDIMNSTNDMEKLEKVCAHLGEQVPELTE